MSTRITVALVVVVAALVSATTLPRNASAATNAPPNARRAHAVGVRTATLTDRTRPTPAVPSIGIDAAPQRVLAVTAWYPTTGATTPEPRSDAVPAHGRFPLILWAHGNSALGSAAPPVVRNWASRGYVVVAPDFPVSSRARSALDAANDWSSQPGDVRFVLEQVLRDRALGGLGRRIDARHVGLAGHSLGAATVLASTYGVDADRRVDALVSISGVPLLDGTDVARRSVPLLLIHADNDNTVPYAQSQAMYATASGPHWLVTVHGGGHAPFLVAPDDDTAKVLDTATGAFFDTYLRGNGTAARRIATLALPGRFDVQTGSARRHPTATVAG